MQQFKIGTTITTRNTITDKYMHDINRLEMITPEEEVALARRIQDGDQQAVNELVEANLRFVISVANQYTGRGLSLGDLINEGNIGLIKAAQKFNDTYGFKFISYAVWWVRQSILQALQEDTRAVRIPVNQLGFLSKIRKATLAFEQKHHRKPSMEEIAKALNVDVEKIENALSINTQQASMDAPITDDGESSLLDVMKDDNSPAADDNVNQEDLKIEVARCMQLLTEREQDVLRMYYGLGTEAMSLEEIGASFDLSRERVRQIKDRAIRTIRNKCGGNLRAFLG